jgi:dihydroorotate dehydrogenase subfamily 1
MYIDSHVHCRDGKQAYKETIKHALEVAQKAGVDAIFDMPNTDPPITNLKLVEERLQLADSCNSPVFYGLYIGLTSDALQIKDAVFLWRKYFPRIVGLKMFAGKSVGDLSVINPDEQMKVYEILKNENFTGVLAVHCEKESFMNPGIWNPENPVTHTLARPSISEIASVNDQILFALNSGFLGHLHICHVSTPESVEYINMIKKNHPELTISCGATPHHLFLNSENMKGKDGLLLKMNPPLRSAEEQKKLLLQLKLGMIDFIETDHAPHSLNEKFGPPYMSGIPWLDSWPIIIEILKDKSFSEKEISDLTFNNVKKIFGIDIRNSENDGKYYKSYESSYELKMKKKIDKVKIGDKDVMPFTIPSGIITTNVKCLKRTAEYIPEIGILTTKSIGPEARAGNREPILTKYAPGCFMNAVGLTNPGCDEFAKELSLINFPKDKFLLVSIFGKDANDFAKVAISLEKYADGFELNLSCPHAKGYGMQLGQDCDTVREITRAVVSVTKKPVFAKLTPNAKNIGEIAKSAIDAGAFGIVAINTVGPGYYTFDSEAVLTNKVGGISGAGILPIGLKCVKEIREAIGEKPFIIAMGGIRTATDVSAYLNAGANAFGIGSCLAGMSEDEIKNYFFTLQNDLDNKTNEAEKLLKEVDMSYKKVKVKEILNSDCDFKIFKTDSSMKSHPGQFAFAWIPGVGEKPFSIMDDSPLTLGTLERGEFTKKFNTLKVGDEFYIRGPYGKGVDVSFGSNVVLIGGGCGLAGIYLLAKKLSEKAHVTCLLGAKDKKHLPYLEEIKKYSEVKIATEDGSSGVCGMVTNLFDSTIKKDSYFFNCGPKRMIEAILPLELNYSNGDKIFSSVDYITRCGVGICGSCSDSKGMRTCVEGPFMKAG